MLALNGGLDTPRVHAILGSSYTAFGNIPAAAAHIKRHIDLVTTELAPASPILAGDSVAVALVPGRTVEIPVAAVAGETIDRDRSRDYWDSIAAPRTGRHPGRRQRRRKGLCGVRVAGRADPTYRRGSRSSRPSTPVLLLVSRK